MREDNAAIYERSRSRRSRSRRRSRTVRIIIRSRRSMSRRSKRRMAGGGRQVGARAGRPEEHEREEQEYEGRRNISRITLWEKAGHISQETGRIL